MIYYENDQKLFKTQNDNLHQVVASHIFGYIDMNIQGGGTIIILF